MKNARKLAKLLTDNIIIFHDSTNYAGLEINSAKLVAEMDYSQNTSKKVGKHIQKIYELYDKAQLEYEKESEKEMSYYEQSKEHARKINDLLGDNNDSQVLVDIVINWRHRNKLGSLYHIFKYWKNNLPLIPAIKCTLLQVKAGKSHDARKKELFEENFYQIYLILLKNDKLPILF